MTPEPKPAEAVGAVPVAWMVEYEGQRHFIRHPAEGSFAECKRTPLYSAADYESLASELKVAREERDHAQQYAKRETASAEANALELSRERLLRLSAERKAEILAMGREAFGLVAPPESEVRKTMTETRAGVNLTVSVFHMVPDDHVLAALREAVAAAGQKAVAAAAGCSPQYVNDALSGRRRVTGKLLAWLGYERVEGYRVAQ